MVSYLEAGISFYVEFYADRILWFFYSCIFPFTTLNFKVYFHGSTIFLNSPKNCTCLMYLKEHLKIFE